MILAVIYGPTPSEKIDICSIDPPPSKLIIDNNELAPREITVVFTPGAGIDEPSLKRRSATVNFGDEWCQEACSTDIDNAVEALRSQSK